MLIKNLLTDSRQITDSQFLICEMGAVVLCNAGEMCARYILTGLVLKPQKYLKRQGITLLKIHFILLLF